MWLYLYKNKMIRKKQSIRHMTLTSSLDTYEHTHTDAHSHKHPSTQIPHVYENDNINQGRKSKRIWKLDLLLFIVYSLSAGLFGNSHLKSQESVLIIKMVMSPSLFCQSRLSISPAGRMLEFLLFWNCSVKFVGT